MTVSTQKLRQHLQAFDFRRLFIESLGWSNYNARLLPFDLDGIHYSFAPVAELGGMVIVTCQGSDGNIPQTGARRKINSYFNGLGFEHIIIFVDRAQTTSLWQWTKHENGTDKLRIHRIANASSATRCCKSWPESPSRSAILTMKARFPLPP